jgi:hypothetical protein
MAKFTKGQIVFAKQLGTGEWKKGMILNVIEPIDVPTGGLPRYFIQHGVYVVYKTSYYREDDVRELDVVTRLSDLA